MSQQRHLAAILFTDIVGYTALMQENEQKAVALIKHYNSSLNAIVALHEGKVLNYYGDGSLCIFPSATEAVNCAIELQRELQNYPSVPLRIGLHIGEVLFEDGKALGDGVNIASRVQSLGQANTILFSKEIYDKVKNHPEFNSVSLGFFEFKNVEEPVEVFALSNEGLFVPNKEHMSGKLKTNLPKRKFTTWKHLFAWSSLAILLAAGFLVYKVYFGHQNYAEDNSIAVLPFINLSSDPNEAFFADGMMDEILTQLYKIRGLRVISRTSSLKYRNSNKSVPEIANELGVANILECSMQKNGDKVRVIAQLISGKKDDHVWAETYDRDVKDIFVIQSDIAQQIASSLKINIESDVRERIESKPTKNIEAYNLFLKGQNSTNDEEGKLYLEEAIRLDSTFAEAYAELAGKWIESGLNAGQISSHEVLKNAEPLVQIAMRLKPNLAQAYIAQAYIDLWYKWDFESVGNSYRRLQLLYPSNPDIGNSFNFYLLALGRFKESMENSSKAFNADSLYFRNRVDFAISNYFMGDSNAALEILRRSYLIRTEHYVWENFIRMCVYSGEYKNALSAYEENKSYFNYLSDNFVLGHAAVAYYRTGQVDSAENLLNILKSKSVYSSQGSPSYYIAAIFTSMSNNEQAIHWLQKAFNDHEVEMYFLKVEPMFNPLRNDPRFREILAKIGFK
jgi:adenylate cyclase